MQIIKLFIKFSIVGLTGVVVNLVVYSALIFLGIYYLIAATLSFLAAVTNNFYWNFIWTFKGKAEHKTITRKYIDFFLISLVNFLLNISVLKILVDSFDVHKILAQAIAIGTASVFNFLGNYFITFKDKNRKGN